MNAPFKLYDQLSQLDSDMLIDNKIICRTINNLDIKHTEIIYALMLHHFILTTGNIPTNPVYNSTIFSGGRGIKALWINLPSKLQKIIAHYIHMNRQM